MKINKLGLTGLVMLACAEPYGDSFNETLIDPTRTITVHFTQQEDNGGYLMNVVYDYQGTDMHLDGNYNLDKEQLNAFLPAPSYIGLLPQEAKEMFGEWEGERYGIKLPGEQCILYDPCNNDEAQILMDYCRKEHKHCYVLRNGVGANYLLPEEDKSELIKEFCYE